MKQGEGLQPVSPAPADRHYDDLPEVDAASLENLYAGLSELTRAMSGDVVVHASENVAPQLNPLNRLARAGLRTLIEVEKMAAELIGVDTTGI